jgi:hypothetical protein
MTIKFATASMTPTPYAKSLIARGLYQKGRHFMGAAISLRQHKGDEYVVLHLLCQGIEIVLKAILLLRDFDKYHPLLKNYRHDLMRLSSDALAEFKLHPLRRTVSKELKELNRMYSQHFLRYGLLLLISIDPNSVSSRLVQRRALAVLRLVDRELTRTAKDVGDASESA